ncbi:N-methyl-L-tryptophan oxidase [Rhizocola hellebori]|nr:N-methyl-L-tryptophan oxidase [Rhizocola hellebori]
MSTPDVDVVVVGLGAMGSNTLMQLARRQVKVLGIEQFEPGHSRGASHGETRIIRTAYAEGAAYVPLAQRAWQLWRELENLSGERLLEKTGGLVIGPTGSAPVLAPITSATAHHLPYELFDHDQMRKRYPQHRLDKQSAAFYEADAGVLRPEKAVRAAIRVAESSGAQVLTGTEVTEIIPDPERPRVRIGHKEIVARHVVVAAGAWLTRLTPAAMSTVKVVRRVFGWFESDHPADYTIERFPVFIRADATDTHVWYGIPSVDGSPVKVAIHFWPGLDEPVDPTAGARPPDNHDADLIAEIVEQTLPGLRPRPVKLQSCMYSLTPDQHFLVGSRADLPGLTVLGGFSGHGFKFSTAIGEIAADLATQGKTSWEIAFLDPERFA